MRYRKPALLHYRLAQLVCGAFSKVVFRRKLLRNEIRNAQGPFVVIANHQAAYDFVNLITLTKRPMSFVISNSFYNSLPITGYLRKMGVIPKQQFQTTVSDMKDMKAVIDAGQPLVVYPAGLMCEDGRSTPIPGATYKFLKWLGVDVYVAKTSGTYFAMPKWSKGFRPGRTYLDVYRLISAQELQSMSIQDIREKTNAALMYDAYREQEKWMIKYAKGSNIEGLENVLYVCPNCGREFTMHVRDGSTIFCGECGYEEQCDEYGFLHNQKGLGPEIRYVSDWSKGIYRELWKKVEDGRAGRLSDTVCIRMIDYKKHKFVDVGRGTLTLENGVFTISGTINGEQKELVISTEGLPTLPFSPGKYLEIQEGKTIYRCVPDDGKQVMKFINLVKIFYQLRRAEEKQPVK